MPNEYILEMRNISKSFPGVQALNNVTLKVRPGSVHALVGENGAGKSTLMKCLFGIYIYDTGEIVFDGETVLFKNPREALANGISMIQQELNPIPYMTVMENIWLRRYPVKNYAGISVIDDKKMYEDTKALFDELNIDIDPRDLVTTLSVSQVQMMEIAKAVSYNARVIVMDEPTSSLTENEVEQLFNIILKLKEQGVAIIYISHRLEEIFKVADEVTIMRDGHYIGTWQTDELTMDMVISRMVGRELTNRFPERHNVPGDVILKVENLTSINPKSFKNVSFELRRGEILGVGGLVGAQRTELMEAIFGIRRIANGHIYINGKEVTIRNPIEARSNKLALVTEDRREMGTFPVLSVSDNILIASWDKYVNYRFVIDERKALKDVDNSIKTLNIKTPSHKTLIQFLSGGNQQKVIFERRLFTEPEIFILDEPTRGIDVGAKYEIYNIMVELAAQGKGIIMISSEMPELLGMSDRIMVMCEGRVSGFVDGKDANEELIMRYATQFA
ncbi:MAG: sugar ABC transporter ATP-binding protein [Thermoanaerobacteraceae bacterium]|nr:sugar ABC transporter ATP-binding protein [Thermoanaerobacteraceae bacterium]